MKIILFGMPASGKDTQANILSKKFDIPHISTGQIFRNEMAKKTELGLKIDSIMKAGKFVDDETTIEVIKEVLDKNDRFIFNGFPRNLLQAQWFDTYCKENDIKIDYYIFFDLDEQTARKRIKTRSTIETRPEDGTRESVNNRFNIYKNDTLPGIQYFKDNKKFKNIQAQLPIQTITTVISALIRGQNG